MTQKHVIVVGAGIVGAMTAFRLATDGARVTLVDAQPAPGRGVSAASFGWITCAAGDPDIAAAEYERRLRAIGDYASLDRHFGGRLCVPVRGALLWGDDAADTRDWARRHEDRGSDVRLVDAAEIARMEPLLAAPPPLAAWFPRERTIDVSQACALLVQAAREAGAAIMLGQPVLGIETKGARASGVRLATGVIAADGVVVAAGATVRRWSRS
ncbi:NAD(P)/FAD-dependent oxidoreductase [Hoeflea olei]|uniref:FAD dependent oxidoreductase domain-containing protein n=1 Tax=Hoeflea olei TaxID=1480615 RepID=A0A1C1YSX0_9HYPH|nr:FAD-dependent oxidoreductase [Hoeflea olei]OCW56595.1 hypothetical protein AWJ14_16770 [Hoeflea olei]